MGKYKINHGFFGYYSSYDLELDLHSKLNEFIKESIISNNGQGLLRNVTHVLYVLC